MLAANYLRISRVIVFLLSLTISLVSFFHFYHLGLTNIYGDGIAHLNIARKVVDLDNASLWAHYAQLGSPWLPLPHILMLPLIRYEQLWRTGIAGSIVSMCSYVLSSLLVFELGRSLAHYNYPEDQTSSLWAGGVAFVAYAFNPSLIYLQTTPMTELPFLATLCLSIYSLLRAFPHQKPLRLIWAGLAYSLACLTRYEAWALLPLMLLIILVFSQGSLKTRFGAVLKWSSTALLGIIYWFWHNWAIFGNAFEFYNGFYSAKHIYLRLAERLAWADFTIGSISLATSLALVTASACFGFLTIFLTMVSATKIGLTILANRDRYKLCLLWLLMAAPFLFTTYSLYTGNIQIYPLSAIALLNVRYGLNFAFFVAFAPTIWLSSRHIHLKGIFLIVVLLLSYIFVITNGFNQIAVIQEPYRNSLNNRQVRAQKLLANYLKTHAVSGKVMLCSGEMGVAILSSSLNFRELIFEGAGEWEQADKVLSPNVNTIVIKEGDLLWQKLANNHQFTETYQLVYQIDPAPKLMVWRRKVEPPK